MCVRWGERAKASELQGKGGKVEVGGNGVLTLFVRHVCVAIYGLRGGVYHTIPYVNYPLYKLSVQKHHHSQRTSSRHYGTHKCLSRLDMELQRVNLHKPCHE